MEFTVGICDDSPEQVQLLSHYMNSYQGEAKFDIIESTKPKDFI